MFLPDLLAGKRILITGGGTGLGKSLGGRFVGLGAELIICGRRQAVLDDTAGEFRVATPGANVTTLTCDIRDPAAVDAMMDQVWAEGPLTTLVNNAAGNFIARAEKMSPRAADAILGSSLHGAMYCTLAAGKRWIAAGDPGAVISILSTSTLTGRAFTAPSAMAKSGLLAMTRSLAVEWGPKGVRLAAIAPGLFPTEGAWARLRPAGRDDGKDPAAGIPLKRVGRHEELANLACFLVSDAGAYITGEMIVIDGGYHLRSSGAEDLLDWTDDAWTAHETKPR